MGEGCWSEVGTDAQTKRKKDEATMQLNLRLQQSSLQKSLVIHEFGHALGLEHEHQRSDFWAVAAGLINEEEMRKDSRVSGPNSEDPAGFNKQWKEIIEERDTLLREKKGKLMLDYDPDSIMHYW